MPLMANGVPAMPPSARGEEASSAQGTRAHYEGKFGKAQAPASSPSGCFTPFRGKGSGGQGSGGLDDEPAAALGWRKRVKRGVLKPVGDRGGRGGCGQRGEAGGGSHGVAAGAVPRRRSGRKTRGLRKTRVSLRRTQESL